MEHLVGELENVSIRDLIGGARYQQYNLENLLPIALLQSGYELIGIEVASKDPVILRECRTNRIVAYWDTYPSLTDLFELAKKIKEDG